MLKEIKNEDTSNYEPESDSESASSEEEHQKKDGSTKEELNSLLLNRFKEAIISFGLGILFGITVSQLVADLLGLVFGFK